MITKLSENAIQNLLEKKEDTPIVQLLSEPKQFLNQQTLMKIEISDGYFYHKKVFLIGNAIPKHSKLKKFMILKVNLNKQQQKQDMIIIDDFTIIYQNVEQLIGNPINYKKFQEGIKNPFGCRDIPLQYLKSDNLKIDQGKLLNPKTLFSESDSSQEKQELIQSKLAKGQNIQNESRDNIQNKIQQQQSQNSQSKYNYLGEEQDFLFSFDNFINKAKYFKQTNQIMYNKSSLASTFNQQNSNKTLEKDSSFIKNQIPSYLQKNILETNQPTKLGNTQQKVENNLFNLTKTSNQPIVQNKLNQDLKVKDKDPMQISNNLFQKKDEIKINDQNIINKKFNLKQQDIPDKTQLVSKEINNSFQQVQVSSNIITPQKIQEQPKADNSQQNLYQQQNQKQEQQEVSKPNTSIFNNLKIKLQQYQQKNKQNKEEMAIESYLSSSDNQKLKEDQYFNMSSNQNQQSAQMLKNQVQLLSGDKYNRVEQKSEQIRQLFISKTSNKLLKKFKSPSPQKNNQGNDNQQKIQFDVKQYIPIKKLQKLNQQEQPNMLIEKNLDQEAAKNNNTKETIQFFTSNNKQPSTNQDKQQQTLTNSFQTQNILNDKKKSEQENLKTLNLKGSQLQQQDQLKVIQQQIIDKKQYSNNNNNLLNYIKKNQNNIKESNINQDPIQIEQQQSHSKNDNYQDFLFSSSEDSQSQEVKGFIKASELKQTKFNQIQSPQNQQTLSQEKIQKKSLDSTKNIQNQTEEQNSQLSKKASKIQEKEQKNIERDWKYLIQAIQDDSESQDENTEFILDNSSVKKSQLLEKTPPKKYEIEQSLENQVTKNINKTQQQDDNLQLNANTEQSEKLFQEVNSNINKLNLPTKQDIHKQTEHQNDNKMLKTNIEQQEALVQEEDQNTNKLNLPGKEDLLKNIENQDQIEIEFNNLEHNIISQKEKIQKQNEENERQIEIENTSPEEINKLPKNQKENKQDIIDILHNSLSHSQISQQSQQKEKSDSQSQICLENKQTLVVIKEQNNNIIEQEQDYDNNNLNQQNEQLIDEQIIQNQQFQNIEKESNLKNQENNFCDIEQSQITNSIKVQSQNQSQKSTEIEQIKSEKKQYEDLILLEEEEADQIDFNIDFESSQIDSNSFQESQDNQISPNNNIQERTLNSQHEKNESILKQQNIKDTQIKFEEEIIFYDKNQSSSQPKINVKNEEDLTIKKIFNLDSPQKSHKKGQNLDYLSKSDEKEKQKTLFDYKFKKDQETSNQKEQNQNQTKQILNQKQDNNLLSKNTSIKKQFKIPSVKLDTYPSSTIQNSKLNQFVEDLSQNIINVVEYDLNQNSKIQLKTDQDKIKNDKATTTIEFSLDLDEQIYIPSEKKQYKNEFSPKKTEQNQEIVVAESELKLNSKTQQKRDESKMKNEKPPKIIGLIKEKIVENESKQIQKSNKSPKNEKSSINKDLSEDKLVETQSKQIQKTPQKSDQSEQKNEKTPIIIEFSEDEEFFVFKPKNQYQNESDSKFNKESITKCKQSILNQNSIQSNDSLEKNSSSNSQIQSQKRKRRRLIKADFEDIILKQLHKDESEQIVLQSDPSNNPSSKSQTQQPITPIDQNNKYSFMKQFEFSNKKDEISQNSSSAENILKQPEEQIKEEQQNNDWESYSDISFQENVIEFIED